MKKTNGLFLATIFSLVLVLSVLPMMSAAVLGTVLYAPLNYTNHTGTITINCTTIHEATNVSVWYNSSAGVMAQLGSNLVNSTTNANTTTCWNGTIAITSAMDGTNYNFSCYADNGTDQTYSAEIAATQIMLDTTAPLCSITGDHKTFPWKGTIALTWTSSDVIELASTDVDVDGPEDQVTTSYTDTSRTLTLTSQDTKYVGDWTTNMTGTDRAGNTCTASYTFKSYLPGLDEVRIPVTPPTDGKRVLLLLLIVGAIVYFGFMKKK